MGVLRWMFFLGGLRFTYVPLHYQPMTYKNESQQAKSSMQALSRFLTTSTGWRLLEKVRPSKALVPGEILFLGGRSETLQNLGSYP